MVKKRKKKINFFDSSSLPFFVSLFIPQFRSSFLRSHFLFFICVGFFDFRSLFLFLCVGFFDSSVHEGGVERRERGEVRELGFEWEVGDLRKSEEALRGERERKRGVWVGVEWSEGQLGFEWE